MMVATYDLLLIVIAMFWKERKKQIQKIVLNEQ